ncbi:MAG TPA: hypothetical protein ENK02_14910 [Planctomycetes bacterium]|nr:hypothetical protein [Planctomycetota bacterium]
MSDVNQNKCQICNQKEAVIHRLERVGSEWVQWHLCESCSALSTKQPPKEGLLEKLGESFDAQSVVPHPRPLAEEQEEDACPGCGMTKETFFEVRRFGCARCYDTFLDFLPAYLERIHEDNRHMGKIPGRPKGEPIPPLELKRLQDRLNKAVAEERYEDAALYRNQIRKLQEKDPSTKVQREV